MSNDFSSDVSVIVDRISSALSPIEYTSVEIWIEPSFLSRPVASRFRRNRFFHRGHSSGLAKSKAVGGGNVGVAIACHHVVL